jgi:hypothetical protein
MDEYMDIVWMIDYTCCTIIWMKNTRHTQSWKAVAFQQKSYWGSKDCINLSLALWFVVVVVVDDVSILSTKYKFSHAICVFFLV